MIHPAAIRVLGLMFLGAVTSRTVESANPDSGVPVAVDVALASASSVDRALLAHWRFDETGGAVARDSTGRFHGNLSATGAAFVAGGISGNALSLNKSANGFVNMGNQLELAGTDFSLVAWIRMTAGDRSDSIILAKHAAFSRNGYLLMVNNSGTRLPDNKASLVEGGTGTAAYTADETPVSTTSVNDGNWHQIVAVYQAGGMRSIYVDGAPAEDSKPSQPFNPNDVAFLLGGVNYEGIPAGRFDGLIDEVQIYSRVLGSGEIDYLFQNPGQTIPSPCAPLPAGLAGWIAAEGNAEDWVSGVAGSLMGGVGFATGKAGQAFRLDGVDDRVVIPASPNLAVRSLTLDAWIFPEDLSRKQPILEYSNPTGYSGAHIWINADASSPNPSPGRLIANLVTDDAPGYWERQRIIESAPGLIRAQTWQHVAVTYDQLSGEARLYLNGRLIASTNLGNFSPATSFPLLIGERPSGVSEALAGARFAGLIDEVHVWNRALSAPEIQAVYIAGGGGLCLALQNGSFTFTSPKPPAVWVTTLAGSGAAGYQEGTGRTARFNAPNGGAVGPDGAIFIADPSNHRIRRIDPRTGEATTYAGVGFAGHSDGPGAGALFNLPIGLCVDRSGNLYVAEAGNHRIRRIGSDSSRTVSTVAGNDQAGYVDGAGGTAQFDFPNDLVLDRAGNLFVSEFNNHTIRKITPRGEVSTFVGNGTRGSADGAGKLAGIDQPGGLAIDDAGNLCVAEWGANRIRRVTPEGVVTTLAGNTLSGFSDGVGASARFDRPDGIVFDAKGYLFVTEHNNHAVRKVALDGTVTTLAGTGKPGYVDGSPDAAQFSSPGGITLDANGNLIIADTGNHAIRLIQFQLPPVIAAQPQSQTARWGGSVTFGVRAEGSGTMDFIWRFNGAAIPGATNAALVLSNVQLAQAGVYSVVIGNRAGSVASGPATLTVIPPAIRRLPQGFVPGLRLVVALDASPPDRTAVYALEDVPPSGWRVENPSHGGAFDPGSGKVKFGPYYDALPRTLAYELTPPPGETGPKQFTGTASVDGGNVAIGGDIALELILRLHPADRSPADQRISIDEVTAFSAAWRRGTAWPLPPNPIPIDYVTRAGFLWRTGEEYAFNPQITNAPNWWVSAGTVPAARAPLSSKPVNVASQRAATRRLPAQFVPTKPLRVTLSVTPSTDAMTYAVQDQIPAGWEVLAASHEGELDRETQQIKWGPFFDARTRELSYSVRPNRNSARAVHFQGLASFDGASIPCAGESEIQAGTEIRALRRVAGGELELELLGPVGASFEWEVSTNLVDWKPVAAAVTSAGVIRIPAPDGSTAPQRFYRAVAR